MATGLSHCWRASARSWAVRAALRWAAVRIISRRQPVLGCAGSRAMNSVAPRMNRQQVVEIMRDAGCQLPDRFQELHLPQRRLHPLVLLDMFQSLAVRRLDLLSDEFLLRHVAADVDHRVAGYLRRQHPGNPAVAAARRAQAVLQADRPAGAAHFVHHCHGPF
jgi:hypothetical protein